MFQKVLVIEADVNNEQDVKKVVDSTVKHFGQLDVLVKKIFDDLL